NIPVKHIMAVDVGQSLRNSRYDPHGVIYILKITCWQRGQILRQSQPLQILHDHVGCTVSLTKPIYVNYIMSSLQFGSMNSLPLKPGQPLLKPHLRLAASGQHLGLVWDAFRTGLWEKFFDSHCSTQNHVICLIGNVEPSHTQKSPDLISAANHSADGK